MIKHALSRVLCLFAAASVASAQVVKAPATSVSDIDQEARNAYQEGCSIVSNTTFRSCQLPPLPPGKRLALRSIVASCSVNAARVAGVQVIHELSDATNQSGSATRFRSALLQPFGVAGERVLSEPIYAHADSAPRIDLFTRDDGTSTVALCNFAVRGYLVSK